MSKLSNAMVAVFPGRAMRIAETRARIARAEYLRTAYDAAKTFDRNRARNSKAIGPILETDQNRVTVLTLARDLDRNTSWMQGVFSAIANNVVGTGIRAEAQVRKKRADSRAPRGPGGIQFDTVTNDQVETAWEKWASGVDVNRTQTFYEFQWMMERELNIAGEGLVVFRDVPPTKEHPISLALEFVTSEQLDTITETNRDTGNEIIQGIEKDSNGVNVAYWIWPKDPADINQLQRKSVRVPANLVLHLFRPGRPGMVRGVSRIHSVARTVEALAQYLDHELTRARVASAFALMVKRGGIGLTLPQAADTTSTETATTDVTEGLLDGGGLILPGGPNDGFESASANVPGTSFEPFVKLMLRSCAVGINVSYGFLARDHSDSNFSAARQEYLEDLRNWRPRQQFLIRRLCIPVFRQFALRAALAGIAPFTGTFDPDTMIRWRTQGWEWVDPVKEIAADVQAIQSGLLSPQEVCQERGRDYYEVVDQIAEAKAYADQAKVNLAIFTPPPPVGVENGAIKKGKTNADSEDADEDESADDSKPVGSNGTRPRAFAR